MPTGFGARRDGAAFRGALAFARLGGYRPNSKAELAFRTPKRWRVHRATPEYRQVLERGATAPLSGARLHSRVSADTGPTPKRNWRSALQNAGALTRRRRNTDRSCSAARQRRFPGRACIRASRWIPAQLESGTGVPRSKTLARSPGDARNTDRFWSAARQRRFRGRACIRASRWIPAQLQSGTGVPHSKTLARSPGDAGMPTGFGARRDSAAFQSVGLYFVKTFTKGLHSISRMLICARIWMAHCLKFESY